MKLILVSNRLPVSIIKRNNKFNLQSSVGGLATGLSSFYKSYNAVWIGWPGIESEEVENKEELENILRAEHCYPVFLSKSDVEMYYYGFCNKTIWPLFHYFVQYCEFNKDHWNKYKQVNNAFCNKVLKIADSDDIIWIHDYHLMLLPKLIREEIPDATIGFFLHIPFPSSEVFRILPWREEILEGLLGSDLIGFHTYDYVRHFLESVQRILGYDYSFDQIFYEDRVVKVDAFPMGIDYERFTKAVKNPIVKREVNRIRKNVGECRIILSMDRLDYTKGILHRLKAYELFLKENPEYKKK